MLNETSGMKCSTCGKPAIVAIQSQPSMTAAFSTVAWYCDEHRPTEPNPFPGIFGTKPIAAMEAELATLRRQVAGLVALIVCREDTEPEQWSFDVPNRLWVETFDTREAAVAALLMAAEEAGEKEAGDGR